MDPRRAFGATVRRFRIAKGLSQERLAEDCGLDRTYISGIERGVRNPGLVNICRLAGALGKAPGELLADTKALGPRL
jgi:transcriptional regulator with XRE-family HTH domain